MTTVEILRTARSLIDEPGKWCKGSFHKDDRLRHCALGALSGIDDHYTAHDVLMRAVGIVLGTGKDGVIPYNDAPERTHSDIMRLYDCAIALAEQEESHAH